MANVLLLLLQSGIFIFPVKVRNKLRSALIWATISPLSQGIVFTIHYQHSWRGRAGQAWIGSVGAFC
jgi:hypothetical protein